MNVQIDSRKYALVIHWAKPPSSAELSNYKNKVCGAIYKRLLKNPEALFFSSNKQKVFFLTEVF